MNTSPQRDRESWSTVGGLPGREVEVSCAIFIFFPVGALDVCVRASVPEHLGREGEKGFRKSPCMQMPSGCTVH